jgi:acyl-CoA thioester hydrolase
MGQTFSHRIRVRYAECDAQGVVFNAHYYAYFDILMTELWRENIGPYDEMVEAGTDMSVVASGARFIQPARFDEEIDLNAQVTTLGNTAMSTAITMGNMDWPLRLREQGM